MTDDNTKLTEPHARLMMDTVGKAFGTNSKEYFDAISLVKQAARGEGIDDVLAGHVFSHADAAKHGALAVAADLSARLGKAAGPLRAAVEEGNLRLITDSLYRLKKTLRGELADDASRAYRLSLRAEMHLPSRDPSQDRCANCPCVDSDHYNASGDCEDGVRECGNECGCPGWEKREEAGAK